VSFDVAAGESLGLVGESGSGKSTTARAILRLIEPTSGRVVFDGEDVGGMDRHALRSFRRRAQIVFQDPFSSLDPRQSAGAMLEEALRVHGIASSRRRDRIVELLERVGLGAAHVDRYPHEFSGGQRQRLGIARALSVGPELVVCDEPVSALDVSIRAQILNLLEDLQAELGLAYLFIAHDLAVVEYISDRVAVMYLGRILEVASAEDLYRTPRHPYTRALLAAAPQPAGERRDRRARVVVDGEVPSALAPPPGCPFAPRCTHPGKDEACTRVVPVLKPCGQGHLTACIKEWERVSEGG